MVLKAWNSNILHSEPIHRLNNKLADTAVALRAWSKTLFSQTKLQLHMATEVILRLDTAQESMELSSQERELRSELKKRVMGLVVLERS